MTHDFGNKLRYAKKARYPVNQLQMSYTDTTDYEGEREPVGYGAGNMDPHQLGFQGEMASNAKIDPNYGNANPSQTGFKDANRSDYNNQTYEGYRPESAMRSKNVGVKKPMKRGKRPIGHGLGFPSY